MKQAIRSQLPKAWASELGSDRFILVQPSEFGESVLVAHGNDPQALDAMREGELAAAVLYRVDETKRG